MCLTPIKFSPHCAGTENDLFISGSQKYFDLSYFLCSQFYKALDSLAIDL